VKSELSDFERAMERLEAWLRRNGAPPEMIGDEQRRVSDMFSRYTVRAPDVELEDEHRIGVGRREFRVVWTPGHTEGHICLHDPERRVLLSGDHVLDPISPNVSLSRGTGGNPLGDYLQSLRKVGALEADLVLPAHGEPFRGLARRVRELLEHHDEREREVLAALSRGARTGTEVAFALPWTRRRRPLTELALGQQRMAIMETLAHLEELRSRDLVARDEREGVALYSPAPAEGSSAAD
jgi:glyoxylase-like metal-dependent hydrolase (beta-lactamase superfamily II)